MKRTAVHQKLLDDYAEFQKNNKPIAPVNIPAESWAIPQLFIHSKRGKEILQQVKNEMITEGKWISSVTPSQQAKAAGLKSLSQVMEITGVSLQTLTNWHRHKPELFKTVILGCKERIDNG